MTGDGSRDTIAFVEKLLVLLDEGRATATYKYAVLLALIDLCMERAAADGTAPSRVPTRAIAEKVAELYWPHSVEFRGAGGAVVLRQNSSNQAEILSLIARYRASRATPAAGTYGQARLRDRAGVDRVVDDIEWKLIQMPLPRLQVLGGGRDHFVYDIAWDTGVRRTQVRRGEFDASVYLRPGVGDHLVRINALLRPLIQRHWVNLVAQFNRDAIEESDLEGFLFGAARTATRRLPVDAKLWMRDREFVGVDRQMIARALTGTPARDTALAAEDEPRFDL